MSETVPFEPTRSVEARCEPQVRWNRYGELEQLWTIITRGPRGIIADAYPEWRCVPTESDANDCSAAARVLEEGTGE